MSEDPTRATKAAGLRSCVYPTPPDFRRVVEWPDGVSEGPALSRADAEDSYGFACGHPEVMRMGATVRLQERRGDGWAELRSRSFGLPGVTPGVPRKAPRKAAGRPTPCKAENRLF